VYVKTLLAVSVGVVSGGSSLLRGSPETHHVESDGHNDEPEDRRGV
jgi:hypothetical protein